MPSTPFLLFTHLEFFQFLKDWWFLMFPLGGAIYAQYKFIVGRADSLAAEAKKDREEQAKEAKRELEAAQAEAKREREEYAKESKRERDSLTELLKTHDERICQVEETDRNALPQFKTLCHDFKKLEEVVKNHHETRFTGIVGQQELFSKLYDAKLDNTHQRVNDLEKRLDRIDDKLDKIIKAVSKKNKK